jgi:NAD(P)-dependent dehydrogenase (short-subunit alcohol dehydrogenase family)
VSLTPANENPWGSAQPAFESRTAMSVIIVTGGTFGIGKAISLTLARRGHRVVAFGLETRQLSSTAEGGGAALAREAEAEHLELEVLEADVSRSDDVTRVVRTVMERFGRIDGLVNNAAIGPLGTILDTTEEMWDRILDVNLKGMFLTCKAVLPHMIAAGGGRIVNVGSGAGHGKANMLAYASSKGGVFAFSAALAYDHFADRIRVNVVLPGGGGMVTGMTLGRYGDEAFVRSLGSGTAAGRSALPEDVANAVAFLMSADAEVISGTVIDVGCFAGQGGPLPKRD